MKFILGETIYFFRDRNFGVSFEEKHIEYKDGDFN